jgi:hypothetical protein
MVNSSFYGELATDRDYRALFMQECAILEQRAD